MIYSRDSRTEGCYWASVDPGIHTGITFWKGQDYLNTEQFNCPRSVEKIECFDVMGHKMKRMLRDYRSTFLAVEDMELWEGSLTSMTSAKRGDLFKVTGLSAIYAYVALDLGLEVRLVLAREWKGTMQHAQVIYRVSKWVDVTGMTDHKVDSIGIGLHALGLFNRGKRVKKS